MKELNDETIFYVVGHPKYFENLLGWKAVKKTDDDFRGEYIEQGTKNIRYIWDSRMDPNQGTFTYLSIDD